MSAPTEIRAGDSVAWTESLPDHQPSDGWSLRYRLLWPASAAVEITAASAGDGFTVAVTGATTAAWAAGSATLVSWVERGSGETLERATIGQAAVTILPDLTTAATFDARSANTRALADAKAALAAYVASGRVHVGEYQIADRTMKFRTADEIAALIQYYERECAKERAALAILQGGSPGRVLTRF